MNKETRTRTAELTLRLAGDEAVMSNPSVSASIQPALISILGGEDAPMEDNMVSPILL